MLDKKAKEKIIKKYQTHENDTGSPQVQIAVLTAEITDLTGHLQIHKKDNSSRRGLIRKINERKKLLKYFQKEDFEAFKVLAKSLNLKIAKKIKQEEEAEKAKNGITEEETKEEEDVEEMETKRESKEK